MTSQLWTAALALLRPVELTVLHAHRDSVRLRSDGNRVVLEFAELSGAGRSWPEHELDAAELARALAAPVPELHVLAGRGPSELRAADALAIPRHELHDLGVVLAKDGDRDPLEWRLLVAGPVVLMSSATGMDGRGFRYLLGVWPGPGGRQAAWVVARLCKLYATGGREGVVHLLWYGHDPRAAVERINAEVSGACASPRFANGLQPPGFRPLDTDAVLTALSRGERVYGPGWDELDAAAVRGYGGQPPEQWAAGEACVMTYRRDLRWPR